MATGLVAPVTLRRTYGVAEAKSAAQATRPADDRLELSPGHVHDEGQSCPICGAQARPQDGQPSPARDATEQAATGDKQGFLAFLGSRLSPEDQEQVSKLKERDREVRAHEQAHMAAGGPHAGSASYSYETGPDGREYAVGGEVSVDLSPVAGDPQATIAKMQQIRRAALAPAQPSSQDRQVATQAARIEAKARAELARAKPEKASDTPDPGLTPATGAVEANEPPSRYTDESAGEPNPAGVLLDIAI